VQLVACDLVVPNGECEFRWMASGKLSEQLQLSFSATNWQPVYKLIKFCRSIIIKKCKENGGYFGTGIIQNTPANLFESSLLLTGVVT